MAKGSGRTTDPETDAMQRILSVAEHLKVNEGSKDALTIAKDRGWIDEAGKPTKDGRRLASALEEQAGTRTVFRNV